MCRQGKEPTIKLESCKELHSGRLQPNIRIEWKLMRVSNTLAFYNVIMIAAVKSFISRAPEESKKKTKLKIKMETSPISIY